MSEHLKIIQARLITAAQVAEQEKENSKISSQQMTTKNKALLKIIDDEFKIFEEIITFLREQWTIIQVRTKQSYSPVNSDEEKQLVNSETACILPKHNKNKNQSKNRTDTASPEIRPPKQFE